MKNDDKFDLYNTISGVNIYISSKFPSYKLCAIERHLESQLRGIVIHSNASFGNIYLIPFNVSESAPFESVPGQFIFDKSNSFLYDTAKNRSLCVNGNDVYFGFDSIFNLSIHFLYSLVININGQALIHAAGFSVNNKTFLAPAFGGIGKTYLISKFSSYPNSRIFGDDLILANQEGEIFPYYRPMCVYQYHYQKYFKNRLPYKLKFLSPDILMRILLRLRLEVLDRFGFELFDNRYVANFRGYVTVPVKDILSDKQVPNKFSGVDNLILIKRTSVENVSVTRMYENDFEYLQNYVASVSDLEWVEYKRFLLAYNAFSGIKSFDSTNVLVNTVKNLLLKAKAVFIVEIPLSATGEDLETAIVSISNYE